MDASYIKRLLDYRQIWYGVHAWLWTILEFLTEAIWCFVIRLILGSLVSVTLVIIGTVCHRHSKNIHTPVLHTIITDRSSSLVKEQTMLRSWIELAFGKKCLHTLHDYAAISRVLENERESYILIIGGRNDDNEPTDTIRKFTPGGRVLIFF